ASIPPGLGHVPTAEEQQLIDRFAPRVVAAARLEGFRCQSVTFVTLDMPNDNVRTMARPSLNPCEDVYIQVSTRYLRQDPPSEFVGNLAHEIGHIVDRDWTPSRASVPQIQREREADAFSLRVLNRLGPADCRAQIEHWRKVRERNIRE